MHDQNFGLTHDHGECVIAEIMEYLSKFNLHRPLHYYGGYFYFITGRTHNGIKYFVNADKKNIFVKRFAVLSKKMNIGISAWVLLENHYHCILHLPEEKAVESRFVLPEFVRKLHSQVASILNQRSGVRGQLIWYQYWDHCIRNETDFWKHFNYILKNPLKHKLVDSLEDGFQYKFSSNPTWLQKFGLDGLRDGFVKYPVAEVFDEEA